MKKILSGKFINNSRKDRSTHAICNGGISRQTNTSKNFYFALFAIGITLMAAGIAAIVEIYIDHHTATMQAADNGTEFEGLKIGTFSISTVALAVVVGGILALIGLIKGKKIRFSADGSVVVG